MHFVWQYCGFMQRRAETYNADQLILIFELECRQKPLKTNERNVKTKEKQQKHQRKTMNKNNDTVTETQQMNNYFKFKKKGKMKKKQ